jgi:pilus assembly protein CpaB
MADRLTLALRSVADAQEPDALVAKHLLSGEGNDGAIQIIKSGVIQKMTNNSTQQAQ